MGNKWIIYKHHIAIDTGKNIIHPDAEKIYGFLSDEGGALVLNSPQRQLKNIRFSQIGSPIKCEINSIDDGSISLELYAIRRNKKCPVDVIDGHIIDHVVAEGEWFYISNDIEGLQKVIDKAQIKSCGSIDIGQYIDLLKQECFAEHHEIINNVEKNDFLKIMALDGEIPNGINADLYDYQKTGYFWLKNMLVANHGCILGDEMGLGKTLQIITIFQDLKLQGHTPVLVVAPVSLLENWKRECMRFVPSLDTYVHHGSKRTGRASDLLRHDVTLISYNTAVSDLSMLRMIDWWCVVLDEAQYIKNPYSERAKSVVAITRKAGIAVTGTPFENHITDIWSLVNFSSPGLLGNLEGFKKKVPDDILGAKKIEPILSSIMLRRMVDDVAQDLPEKIVIPQVLSMSDAECAGYIEVQKEVKNAIDKNSAVSLALLQKLRMYCTHQFLVGDKGSSDPAAVSIKYQRFCELLGEIINMGEKVIVFTSYKRMFDIFYNDIPHRFGVEVGIINGETPVDKRQETVDWFNNYSETAVLVLNPRAAGNGLNITGANHVIHYNLEWNPALEDQASARAYRRGQKKTVFIYRLYYTDTVEQVVNERIERKRKISSTAVVGTDGKSDKMDILRALELVPKVH